MAAASAPGAGVAAEAAVVPPHPILDLQILKINTLKHLEGTSELFKFFSMLVGVLADQAQCSYILIRDDLACNTVIATKGIIPQHVELDQECIYNMLVRAAVAEID